MTWYSLKYSIDDKFGVTPTLAYDHKFVRHDYYQNLITNHSLWKNDEPVHLWMYDNEGVLQIPRNMMSWSSGEPEGETIVCSDCCIDIIEQLVLPRYTFYPVKLRIGKKLNDFWLFHYLWDLFSMIDFSNSRFCFCRFGSDRTPVKKLPKGYVKNSRHIQQLVSEQLRNKLRVKPYRLVFNNMPVYDIWSLYGQHIISEKAMLLFKEAGITGIDMIPLKETEWKHLEIVMPQTQKLSVVIEK
jgi:hypothetical protein